MKVLPVVLISAGLLVGCGTAAKISGSSVNLAPGNQTTVQLRSGANAGSGVNASADDVNRVNPLAGKGHVNQPVVPAQPRTVAPVTAPITDRCTSGTGAPAGNAPAKPGKQLPLPACMPQ